MNINQETDPIMEALKTEETGVDAVFHPWRLILQMAGKFAFTGEQSLDHTFIKNMSA